MIRNFITILTWVVVHDGGHAKGLSDVASLLKQLTLGTGLDSLVGIEKTSRNLNTDTIDRRSKLLLEKNFRTGFLLENR